MMFAPPQIARNAVNIGVGKTKLSPIKMLLMGILAGLFIGFGAVGFTTVGSVAAGDAAGVVKKLLGACVFPGGLSMVVVAGSELFTGNCLIPMACLDKKARWVGMLKNWLFVYIGNLLGSMLLAWFMNISGLIGTEGAMYEYTMTIAKNKCALSFGAAFFRGIMCNFLVCIAVWMSFSAKTTGGKIAAVFFPIMLFVLAGYEHSVANMYYIPAALFAPGAGALGITWGSFFGTNLLPVTLGNIVGGSIMVGVVYWYLYIKGTEDPALKK